MSVTVRTALLHHLSVRLTVEAVEGAHSRLGQLVVRAAEVQVQLAGRAEQRYLAKVTMAEQAYKRQAAAAVAVVVARVLPLRARQVVLVARHQRTPTTVRALLILAAAVVAETPQAAQVERTPLTAAVQVLRAEMLRLIEAAAAVVVATTALTAVTAAQVG